ncbi:MAG: transposase [Hydrogenophaga sp.]
MDDVDRRALLDVLTSGLEQFDACALAWCFIGNHYHFVLQPRQPSLSLLMRHINGVFTQRFNQRHHKAGHLFQGRFNRDCPLGALRCWWTATVIGWRCAAMWS